MGQVRHENDDVTEQPAHSLPLCRNTHRWVRAPRAASARCRPAGATLEAARRALAPSVADWPDNAWRPEPPPASYGGIPVRVGPSPATPRAAAAVHRQGRPAQLEPQAGDLGDRPRVLLGSQSPLPAARRQALHHGREAAQRLRRGQTGAAIQWSTPNGSMRSSSTTGRCGTGWSSDTTLGESAVTPRSAPDHRPPARTDHRLRPAQASRAGGGAEDQACLQLVPAGIHRRQAAHQHAMPSSTAVLAAHLARNSHRRHRPGPQGLCPSRPASGIYSR